MSGIAISYRRSDSSAIAGRIFDRLVLRYGKQAVFMDIENIPLGIDFRTHIQSVLLEADVLLVLIGRHWTGAGAGGGARIREETDPVRREVEQALEREMPIIPVLVDGAAIPGEADLPASLRGLAYLNAAEVTTGQDFNAQMDRVIAALDRMLPGRSVPAVVDRLIAALDRMLPAQSAPAAPAAEDVNPAPGTAADPGPLPQAPAPESWLNELVLYLLVPLAALLVAHHLIVNSLDLSTQYLRTVSFALPFLFGFIRCWRGGRGAGSAFAFALTLGLIGVAGMTISEGLNSGDPIMPETRAEWRENIEYAVSIALSFMAGHVLASALNGRRRRKFQTIKGTRAHGRQP